MARPFGTKYIATPEAMELLFEDYVKTVKAKPFLVKDWVGKDGIEVFREKEKPLTMEGFSVFCHKKGFTIKHYFDNTNNSYEDYCIVCSHIKEIVRQDQIEGGMAGVYNPSITQRLNNLVEKQSSEINVNQVNANFGQPLQSPPKPEDNPRLD